MFVDLHVVISMNPDFFYQGGAVTDLREWFQLWFIKLDEEIGPRTTQFLHYLIIQPFQQFPDPLIQ